MQAISTKYIGPTNYRGSRVKAEADAGSVTISWEYGLNSDANHARAALYLMRLLDWDSSNVHSGTIRDGRMVWLWSHMAAQTPIDDARRNLDACPPDAKLRRARPL